jgi:hypothetical protein
MSENVTLGTVTAKTTTDNSQFDAATKKSSELMQATARENAKAAKLQADAIALSAKLAGTAVTEQSLQIVKAYKAQASAQADLRKATQLSKFTDEDTGVRLRAAAYQQLTEAKLATAAASNVENAATERTILTQRSAVSAVVRATEGQQGIRAVEGFLTMIPGVGAAMQAIFPLIGGAMFLGLLVKMGEEFYKNEQRAKQMGVEVGRAWGEMNTKALMANDEMELSNSKMQDQIDKLEKHPSDGLRTALLEAATAADHLQEHMAAAMKESEALLGQEHVNAIWGMLSNTGGTGAAESAVMKAHRDAQDAMEGADAKRASDMAGAGKDPTKQDAANKNYYAAVSGIMAQSARDMRAQATKIADDQAARDKAVAQVNASPQGYAPRGVHRQTLTSADDSASRGIFEQQAVQFDRMQRMAQDSASQFDLEKSLNNLKGDGKPKKDGEEDNSTPFTDWIKQQDDFKKRAHESLQQTNDEIDRQQAAAAMVKADGEAKVAEAEKKAAETAAHYAAAVYLVSDANTKAALSMQDVKTKHALATAAISRPEAIAQIAAQRVAAYQAQLAGLAREKASLTPEDVANGRGKDIDAKTIAVQSELDRVKLQDGWDQFESTGLGGAITALQDFAAKATDAGAAIHEFLTDGINDVNGGLVKMLTDPHWQHQGQWGGIGHSIATSGTSALLKGAEGSVLKGLHINKIDGSSEGFALWVRMAGITSSAASAVGKTASGALGKVGSLLHLIGIPGFDVGTNLIPQDMLAMVHKNEAIVPAAYNPAAGANGVGGGHTFNIDARGATDPALVRAQVMQGLRDVAPHIVRGAVAAMDARSARNPSGKRF